MALHFENPLTYFMERDCVLKGSQMLFNNQEKSDIVFVVGKKDDQCQKIYGHKQIIGFVSSALEAASSEKWSNSNEIRIKDFDVSPFASVLRFIYTEQLVVEKEHVLETVRAADMYLVTGMLESLLASGNLNTCKDVIWDLLNYACQINSTDMKAACLSVVTFLKKGEFVKNFTNLSHDALLEVVQHQVLSIKEGTLFDCCMMWAEEECKSRELPVSSENKRLVLGPVLKNIRFAFISRNAEDLSQKVDGVLNPNQVKLFGKAIESRFLSQATVFGTKVVLSGYNSSPRVYFNPCRDYHTGDKYHCGTCSIYFCEPCRDCHDQHVRSYVSNSYFTCECKH